MQPDSFAHEYHAAPRGPHHLHYHQQEPDDGLLRMRRAMELYTKNKPGAGATVRAIEQVYKAIQAGEL